CIPGNDSLERDISELLTRPVGATQSQADHLGQRLSLPSGESDEDATSGVEGRVSWRGVPIGGVHCDESGDAWPDGRAVLLEINTVYAVRADVQVPWISNR